MMNEVFSVPVSMGTISQLELATTEAIAAPVVALYGPAQKEGMVV